MDAKRTENKPVELSSLAHVYGYYQKQGFVPVNRKTKKQIRFPRGRSILALNNAFVNVNRAHFQMLLTMVIL